MIELEDRLGCIELIVKTRQELLEALAADKPPERALLLKAIKAIEEAVLEIDELVKLLDPD